MVVSLKNNRYAIGTLSFSFTDESREEVLGTASGKRKIEVRLYYPVQKDSVAGMKKSRYVSETKEKYIRQTYHLAKSATVIGEVELYENAPMLAGEKFPLVLYSHGYGAYVEANTFLCMELAARGYMVASVGHSYEGLCTEYEDGSFVTFDQAINKKMYKKGALKAIFAQMKLQKKKCSREEADEAFWQFEKEHTPYLMERVKEWGADELCALNEVRKRYGIFLDFSKGVAATGHSLGGATAYYLCQTSEEISCGLNIDGGLFGEYQNMTMQKPFFQIGCRENRNLESSVFLRTEAPVYCALFANMKHNGFTDAKFFFSKKMLVGKMDAAKVHDSITNCHTFFLDRYLKGLEVEELQMEDDEIELSGNI